MTRQKCLIIFKTNGKLLKLPFSYGKKVIECVATYKCLGIHLAASGHFSVAEQELYKKGLKSYFKLKKITHNMITASTHFQVFDSMVRPILLYGSDIWGIKHTLSKRNIDHNFGLEKYLLKGYKIEDLNMLSCRQLLGIHKRSSKIAIYGETGRFPLYIETIVNTLKYYNRLSSTKGSPLLKEALECNKMLHGNGKSCWYSNILALFKHLGIRHSSSKAIDVRKVKSKLQSRFISYWRKSINGELTDNGSASGNKLRTYAKFKTNHAIEAYLDLLKNRQSRSIMAKFRTSSHKLKIETGRYTRKWNRTTKTYVNTPQVERICRNCEAGLVEDELHFLVICPKYSTQREILFERATELCKPLNL